MPADTQNPPNGFPGKDDLARSPVLYTKLINNQIRGYYMTGGTSFYDGGGSVRRFTLTTPIPSPISGATATFSARIADGSYNLNLSKHQGPQSLLLVETVAQSPDRGLLFAGTTNPYRPLKGGLARSVSLILTQEASPFGELFPVPQTQGNVPVSHLPTDYQIPDHSGRGPEGMAVMQKGNDRFVFVNNYHEGTITIFHINGQNPFNRGPFPLCELDIDKIFGVSLGDFAEPDGNLNRPLAIAHVTCPVKKTGLLTYLLVGLNFDPPLSLPPGGLDGHPDEGTTDYLVVVDVTDLSPTTTSCQSLPVLAIPLGPSNQGTVIAIAVHPDEDFAYVISTDLGIQHQNEKEEAYLYAVDLCLLAVTKTIQMTGASPGLGLPNNPGEHIVAVRNPNLNTEPTDRLYIGTYKAPGSAGTADGHILVFGLGDKTCPALLNDFDLTVTESNDTSFHVTGLVAVPLAFLGADLCRNVILGIGTDLDTPIKRADRFILFEDR